MSMTAFPWLTWSHVSLCLGTRSRRILWGHFQTLCASQLLVHSSSFDVLLPRSSCSHPAVGCGGSKQTVESPLPNGGGPQSGQVGETSGHILPISTLTIRGRNSSILHSQYSPRYYPRWSMVHFGVRFMVRLSALRE